MKNGNKQVVRKNLLWEKVPKSKTPLADAKMKERSNQQKKQAEKHDMRFID